MAVVVNGEKIEDAQIQNEAKNIKSYYEQNVPNSDQIDDEKIYEVAKENVIKRYLLMEEAKKMDKEVTEDELQEEYNRYKSRFGDVDFEQIKEDLKTKIKYDYLLDEIVDDVEEPSEEEIDKIYTENKDQFKKSPQVHAAHIVKNVDNPEQKEEAYQELEDIKEKIDNGESFEKMADKHSDCNDDQGDLGFFPRGKMVPEFEDQVFSMETGEVSDIFSTPFGYHIAKVYEKKSGEQMAEGEAKNNIQQQLINRNKSQNIEQYANELMEKAEIQEVQE